MILSTAKQVTEEIKIKERRISTNGKAYRIEFRLPGGDWFIHSNIYSTLELAMKNMQRMNDSDNELSGDWNVVEGAR